MRTAMTKALHEHTYDDGFQECSCGKAFTGDLAFDDYCQLLSDEMGVAGDPESTGRP